MFMVGNSPGGPPTPLRQGRQFATTSVCSGCGSRHLETLFQVGNSLYLEVVSSRELTVLYCIVRPRGPPLGRPAVSSKWARRPLGSPHPACTLFTVLYFMGLVPGGLLGRTASHGASGSPLTPTPQPDAVGDSDLGESLSAKRLRAKLLAEALSQTPFPYCSF